MVDDPRPVRGAQEPLEGGEGMSATHIALSTFCELQEPERDIVDPIFCMEEIERCWDKLEMEKLEEELEMVM